MRVREIRKLREMRESRRRNRQIYQTSNICIGLFFIIYGLYGLLLEHNAGGGVLLLLMIFIGVLCLHDARMKENDYVSPSRRARWKELNK